ncbi:MAG: ABC transporter ATP-binding protein [Deltaproteobacteria bacterium]|nr:ABC transporter ATP-binding protein [Deltaproteobacteria bacterium]
MGFAKTIEQFRSLSRILKPYKKFLFESVLTGLMLSLLSIPGPWLTKILIDDVYTTGEHSLLYFIVLLILSFSLFQALMSFLRNFFMANISMRMTGDIQMLFFDHLQQLSCKFYDVRETGEITSRFSDISGSLSNSMALINTLAFNIVQIIIFPFVLFYISWKLTLLALIVLPFEIASFLFFNSYIKKYTPLVTEANAELNARVIESIEGIKTIQSLKLESTFRKMIREKIFYVLNFQAKLTGSYQASVLLQGLLKASGMFLYTLFGWKYILRGDMTLGVFLAFSSYVGYFYGPVLELFGLNRQIEAAFTHTGRFLEIYDRPSDIEEPDHNRDPEMISGHISLKDVGFSYDGRERVLNSISLEIPFGTVVALVGRSGVGKTTLANLIARFYDPICGRVSVDGHDLKDLSYGFLRANIGYVMQEPFLFNGTIKENILLSLTASREKFDQAVADAYVDEFIGRLPDGFHTIVGQKGVKLSSGQKQRIAMARVLLRNTPILILDEPTSSLDFESEEIVQKAMRNVVKNRTTVIIAHRISTIRNVDIIVVLENGDIVEQGDHRTLMKAEKYYYAMYSKMARI